MSINLLILCLFMAGSGCLSLSGYAIVRVVDLRGSALWEFTYVFSLMAAISFTHRAIVLLAEVL